MIKKIILLLALAILITGCAKVEKTDTPLITEMPPEETQPESVPEETPEEIPEEEKIIPEETPKPAITNPLNVPRVNTAAHIVLEEDDDGPMEEEDQPGLCYLGSFAMLALFDDLSLDLADVVAYSGVGSIADYDSRMGLNNAYKERSIIAASQNLGYSYIVGAKSGGKINSFMADFKSSASEVKNFKNEEEAFNHLKQIIDSGKPVEVHLDAYYVVDDFRKSSKFWVTDQKKEHFSHFMVVTGYDSNNVYINDPTDPNMNVKNMKATKANFFKAWENGDKTPGAQVGPYWMFYLKEKKSKKSIKEIISWNKEISQNAAKNIRRASSSEGTGELGVGRKEFAKFLEKNGYTEAAKLYKEAADIYLASEDEPEVFKEIAQKEEQARNLL